jgi:lipoprotein-anchoring transpeptidase ErfK/SrfK
MVRSIPELPHKSMLNRLLKLSALGAVIAALSACGTVNTVTDMVTSHVPERHSGRASIVVDLGEQEAYLYRGKHRTGTSRISSGREGYRTPVGRFAVIRKDIDHRSSLYGSYVDDDSGRVVKANVDTRKDRKPSHSHFEGAPMPFFLEFSPSYGLHQGYLPGEPASHGCIRMPYWKARQFYDAARVGTSVVVKP